MCANREELIPARVPLPQRDSAQPDANTELCGGIDTVEGRIQMDPEGPREAEPCEPHGAQQGQGPAHGMGQFQGQTQAGRKWDGAA